MENNKPQVRFKDFEDHWKSKDVGQYYDFKNGLNKGKEYFGYGTPIINFTDVFHNRGLYIDKIKGKVNVNSDELKNYNVRKGDLFFTRTSETIEEIGFPSVMLDDSENTVFSGFVLRARPIYLDPLVNDFKKYAFFIESFRSEMVKKSSMTTRALTSGTAIKKMLFSFPENKEEQQKIGTFFENLDKLITGHKQKHNKLKELKKAMLFKMFPQQGQTVPEIRFKGFAEGWVEIKLGDKVPVRGGFAFKSICFRKEGIPILKISNILPSGEVGGVFDYYDEIEQDNNIFLPNKSAVIAMSGATTGKVSILKILENEKVYQNQRVGYFENKELVNYGFISTLVKSSLFERKMRSVLVAGAQPNVSPKEIDSFEFLIPNDKEEQRKIGEYFNNIDELINNYDIQILKFQNIKKAFLAKMFI